MSWNSMLEGFERHAQTTGQENPLHAMQRQESKLIILVPAQIYV